MNWQLVHWYNFSVSKNENMLKKKKQNKLHYVRKQKKEKSFLWLESNPRPFASKVNTLFIAPRQPMINMDFK